MIHTGKTWLQRRFSNTSCHQRLGPILHRLHRLYGPRVRVEELAQVQEPLLLLRHKLQELEQKLQFLAVLTFSVALACYGNELLPRHLQTRIEALRQ